MTTSQPGFLGLPLEVRHIIYNFCYCIPLTGSRYDWVPVPESESESNSPTTALSYWRDNGTLLQLRKIATKCLIPKCHLWLLSVCRQIRNEYFPIFAARHTFSFCDPLVFANEYLSYTPPHRYSNIRHLALNWDTSDTSGTSCDCEVVGQCRTHGPKTRDVSRDLRNLIRLVDIYPELFRNLESIRFNFRGDKTEIFKNAVVLLEKMDDLNSTTEGEKRKYLLVPHSRGGSYYTSPMQLNIFAVSDEIWDLSIDGATLVPPDCQTCKDWPDVAYFAGCTRHDVDWKNTDQFLSALKEGKLRQRETKIWGGFEARNIYAGGEKNWKVFFDTTHSVGNAWENAMVDFNVWKGNNVKLKQRSRKRKAVD